MPRTRFEFAPPSFPLDGTFAVPMDIQQIWARLRFDPLLGDTLEATVNFITGPTTGYPVFDLRQTIREAWLDGQPLAMRHLRHRDLGGGANSEMRVIERELAPGTEHSLRIIADLGPPQVPMQRNRLPKIEWEDGRRLSFRFGFTDRRAARYLESWIPANLIYDEFELTIDVIVANTPVGHQVITNGAVECRAINRWTIRFPDTTCAFSPLVEIYAADRLVSERQVMPLPATGRTIAVEAWKLAVDPADLKSSVAVAGRTLASLDAEIGPYPHGDRFLMMLDSTNDGMEFAGAMTGDSSLIRHEICHSWWGRGVTAASQDDAWWDEGWTEFFADRDARAELLDLTSAPTAYHSRNPWSRISILLPRGIGDYHIFQLIAAVAGSTALTDAMRQLYARNLGTPLTTKALEEHLLKAIPDPIVVDLFHRFVYGHNDPVESPKLVFIRSSASNCQSKPQHWQWDDTALWNRNELNDRDEHQVPVPRQVNWLQTKIRNEGSISVLHAAVVFQVQQSPIFDPSGPAVPKDIVAVSVQQDWLLGEERVVTVPWVPVSSNCALTARLVARGLNYDQGTQSEWESFVWKNHVSMIAQPEQEIFVNLFLRNGFGTESRQLLLELIRDSESEPIEVMLSHNVGLPMMVCQEPGQADSLPSERSHITKTVQIDDPQDSRKQAIPTSTLIQEFIFPPDDRSNVLLLLPSQSLYIPSLLFTIPASAANGDIVRFDVVARRPEDGFLVGGMTLAITIERFD